MRRPPNTDEYKTQYIRKEFRGHCQEAVRQRAGDVLALHLGHVNFQHEDRNNDSEDSVAECLDPRGGHLSNSEKPIGWFMQASLVFDRAQFGQIPG